MDYDKTSLNEKEAAKFHNGQMYDAYRYFGPHLNGEETRFTVWAPDVAKVAVIGTAAGAQESERFEMKPLPFDPSIWEVLIPRNLAGFIYKYDIETIEGERIGKSDPYARSSEMRPDTCSIVPTDSVFKWSEEVLQQKQQLFQNHFEKPLAIYELHMGTWKRAPDGSFLTYREIAEELIPYVKKHGFTHIEILPITEHPLDESWGYQTTGYFAPTSRYGTAEDLKYFINECARNGLGIFLDWVPGHFCQDLHGLVLFNGRPLYEDRRKERRKNPEWGTMNFDVQRGEVVSFLLSSAHYWLDEFKFDGFRMDALMKLLFVPNDPRRIHNEEGADFLRQLTSSIKLHHPSAILIAEDAWHYPNVTGKAEDGGIGFDYKWNFGWMHDTLSYMETPPEERSEKHQKLNFSLMYYYDERYVSIFSHDEVVHGQKSLLNKLPGSKEEKFHQLRLLLAFWITHPGKKLLFMGQEFGHDDEWKFQPELDWFLLDQPSHRQMDFFTKELLAFYKSEKALFELDNDRMGFEWLDPDNHEQSVLAYIRRGRAPEAECIVVGNFSNQDYSGFEVGVPQLASYECVFSTASPLYGGWGTEKGEVPARSVPVDGQSQSIAIELPAFAMQIWKKKSDGSEKS